MANRFVHYTDDERERLRRALLEYSKATKKSAQWLADAIAERTNYAIELDAGRKRVERFLKGNHRQPDDFINAVANYLGSVPSPNMEESAATLAHFFSRRFLKPIELEALIGRYQVWLSKDRRSAYPSGEGERTVLGMFGEFSPAPANPLSKRIAYAVIELKPLAKYNALLVAEGIFNLTVNPHVQEFPEDPPRNVDAGILVAFGHSERDVPRYFGATRSVLESRMYRLFKTGDKPLTLRGELNFNGGIGRTHTRDHADPLYPDYEVELVRIEHGNEDAESV